MDRLFFNIILLTIGLLNLQLVAGQTRVNNESVVKEANNTNSNSENVKARIAKNLNSSPYNNLLTCAISMNGHCFLDESENLLRFHYHKLWAEADREALSNGRETSTESVPSKLMETIPKLIRELTELLSQGVAGLFRDAKENEDDEEDDELSGTEDEEDQNQNVEESRGKKKKKRKAIIKLLVIGAVLAAKLSLLLKVLALKIQLKFLLLAVLSLLLNGARFFYDLKKGHQPQKVVYYEHAQHQHHYEHEDDWGGGGGGHWDRSLDAEDEEAENKRKIAAQEIAYAKYRPYARPTYSLVNNKPNYSWDDKK